jgi:hypothetical protein
LAHDQRTHASDHPISQTEVGGTSPGAIENQQLLLDEYGLGHHGTRPARTGEPGDSRQEADNQDSQVTHRTIVTSERNPGNAKELGIRHAQDQQLLLDVHGFGQHGARAAGPGEPDDRRQQMEKQDGQIAHGTIVTACEIKEVLRDLTIRHAHVHAAPLHY